MKERLLISKDKAMRTLGLGEAAFDGMGFPYVPSGKRKKYVLQQLLNHLEQIKRDAQCPLKSVRVPRSTGTTSQSHYLL